jgi:transcriptional regulator with XRE-family HTH domain
MRNGDGYRTGDSLAERLRTRIDQAYGGNQRAFAAAAGLTPQHVYAMLSGKIALPRPEVRRVLAREFGISHPKLLVLAGELDPDEVAVQEIPLPAEQVEIARVFGELSPTGRDALLALARELLRQDHRAAVDMDQAPLGAGV